MISSDKPYFKLGVYTDLDEVYKITEVSRINLELICSKFKRGYSVTKPLSIIQPLIESLNVSIISNAEQLPSDLPIM